MKTENKKPSSFRLAGVLAIAAVCLVIVNVLLLIFVSSESKTVKLLKDQAKTLAQEEKIVNSANDIYKEYQDEIEIISAVFPNEESIATFIQTLESIIRQFSDEYTLRFTSVTPVKEADRLFLPVVITAKTDMSRLTGFLTALERAPYMTRILSIDGKGEQVFGQTSEVQIVLKVYVQNPFSSQ